MKNPKAPIIEKLRISEARRQAILDVLNRAGAPMATPAIQAEMEAAGVAVEKSIFKGTLCSMIAMGEVDRHGTRAKLQFSALTDITKSAEVVSQAQKDAQSSRRRRQAREQQTAHEHIKRKQIPGVYIHNNPNRRPLKNQGGQGAERKRVFVSIGHDY